MKISDILRHKGTAVTTIEPLHAVTDLVRTMTEQNIGAVVVRRGEQVVGIVSERDIVRHLDLRGADLLHDQVEQIMSTPVVTCASTDDVDSIAQTMTERRVRHMPVVDDGHLVGIVSIGDVVSSRMRQLEHDRGQLEQYITG